MMVWKLQIASLKRTDSSNSPFDFAHHGCYPRLRWSVYHFPDAFQYGKFRGPTCHIKNLLTVTRDVDKYNKLSKAQEKLRAKVETNTGLPDFQANTTEHNAQHRTKNSDTREGIRASEALPMISKDTTTVIEPPGVWHRLWSGFWIYQRGLVLM
jgi:hypothetical protein